MANATVLTVDAILEAAERMTQAIGYHGLSFRTVAAAVGIKSASVHYHFPSKGLLGAAIVRRYTDRLVSLLEDVDARGGEPKAALAAYVGVLRATLQQQGRMCLGGLLAAETDGIPPEVQVEVRRFVEMNVQWLAGALERVGSSTGLATREHARALFAAIEGAMLIAHGTGDLASFDAMTEQFGRTGLLPR